MEYLSHLTDTKRNALLLEWWAFGDSNPGPTGYEPVALTN